MNLKAFDLFSGIGGFRHGIDMACKKSKVNVEWVGWCDFDKYVQKTYRACFDTKNEQFISDITEITGPLGSKSKITDKLLDSINSKIIDFDILTAGFPCQAFSSLGKRKGLQDERGTLFYAIELLLLAKKPKYFLLENVSGLKSIDNGNTIKMIRRILEKKLGYNVAIWDLNAKNYGVPQNRRRIFIAGGLNGKLSDTNIPTEILKRKFSTVKHLLDKKAEDKYYLSEKIKKTIIEPFPQFNENPVYNLDIGRCLTRTMHKMHRCSQDNYYSDSYILDKKNKINDKRIRRITPKEGFRLQGFSEHYIKKALNSGVSDTQLYMQIGNAVPATMVCQVFKQLLYNE